FDLTPENPDDAAGTLLQLDSCAPGGTPFPGEPFDLGRLTVLNYSGQPTVLQVRQPLPAMPGFACPSFLLCDAPVFSQHCMAPTLGSSDLVFDVALNPASCNSGVFIVENLTLDTHEAANDGAAGPITTMQSLSAARTFLVTVQGTASLSAPST